MNLVAKERKTEKSKQKQFIQKLHNKQTKMCDLPSVSVSTTPLTKRERTTATTTTTGSNTSSSSTTRSGSVSSVSASGATSANASSSSCCCKKQTNQTNDADAPRPRATHQQQQQTLLLPPNPYQQASWLSRLFFTWPFPLLQLGLQRALQPHDLPDLLLSDHSSVALADFQRIWNNNKNKQNNRHSLPQALMRDYFQSVAWLAQPLMLAGAIAKVGQAVILGKLIDSLTVTSASDNHNHKQGNSYVSVWIWPTLLVVCAVVLLFEHHHLFFHTWRKGMSLRIACIAAIYDKSLRLPSHDQGCSSNTDNHNNNNNSYGKIMNLASNDVERFIMAALFANYIFWAPIQCLIILVVGWWQLGGGPAFVVGVALLLTILIPLQTHLGRRFAYFRSKIAALTDRRVSFVAQAIRGVRVMKMSGYEHRFAERIAQYRQDEITQIARANQLKAWNEAIYFFTNVVISLVIFVVHVMTGHLLEGGTVFTVFTLINILQLEMTKHLSLAVMSTSECWVSMRRIQHFLELPELNQNNNSNNDNDSADGAAAATTTNPDENLVVLALNNITCYWNDVSSVGVVVIEKKKTKTAALRNRGAGTVRDDDLLLTAAAASWSSSPYPDRSQCNTTTTLFVALQNVSINFSMVQLTAVIGTVGSGKSALLQAIVKELPVSSGTIQRRYTSLAYAAQDPWIMDGTVQENILMGSKFDSDWYQQVVSACGLVLDFEQHFRHGDQTILGDRGVQCSGGQRARIGLARAIYRRTDVLVVDDPLSAVDAKVGRQIYQEALLGLAVARGKCVILATHQHQYVSDCRCVLMMEGRVQCIGTYLECVDASRGKLTAHAADDVTVDGLEYDETTGKEAERKERIKEHGMMEEPAVTAEAAEDGDADIGFDSSLDDDHKEINQQGNVEWDTYASYLQAMGGVWIGGFLFLLFAATQGSVLVTIAQVGRWAEQPAADQDDWSMIGMVLGLGGVVIVLAVVRAFISFHFTIKASQRLHDRMAKAVLRAKIQFFDTNPLGRILNRFSADVGILDDMLPPTLFDFFMIAFMVLGAVVTTVSTLPFVLTALPFLMWYFWHVRKVFVTSSRELKRLEGLARSPIFSMLSESLGGIATIRSNDAVDYFRSKFHAAHDAHSRSFFSFIAASRWVGFRMDSLVFLLLVAVSFLSVLFHQQGWFQVDPSLLGLSLSMLLQLTGLFQWCIRQSAEVVNYMVSTERLIQFSKVEPEAPLQLDGDPTLLKSGWPSHGSIQVENLSVRYRTSLPLAHQEISFSIPPGSRVGIVGRTGSGKSTVVQTLFRLLEAEHGRIVIDGVDVARLGLHALRTKISVIPQVPTLFSGCSIRENLDLFGLHTEEEIDKVLRDCHLSQLVGDLPQGIHSPVSEGGSNFSVGQRQLLCLARAILSRNKILVLDEATASVDRRTDQLLQKALQESFHDGTILAVAHRLDTVIEFDYIIVMGSGRVLEFGTPAELIRRENGPFASMVSDTGETMAGELRQLAIRKEDNNNTHKNLQ